MSVRSWVSLASLLAAGCGGTTLRDGSGGSSGANGAAGDPAGGRSGNDVAAPSPSAGAPIAVGGKSGGDVNGGKSGAEAGGTAGASGAASSACARADERPGTPVTELGAVGGGVCGGTTLARAIEDARVLRPDLSDVTTLFVPDPSRGGDGSFIYAFLRSDGGFALVFKRGGGDCPSGCTENDYYYFRTSANCAVEELGETHRGSDQSCIPGDQPARWGIPPAPPPSAICGADLTPQDISDRYTVVTCGRAMACATSKEMSDERALPEALPLIIEQDPSDLSRGTVTLDGTGEPLIDGKALTATFSRRSFKVYIDESNLPATCIERWSLDWELDLEGFGAQRLELQRVSTPDCDNQPGDYCKGFVSAQFGEAFTKP